MTTMSPNFPDLSMMPPIDNPEVKRFKVMFHEDLVSHYTIAVLYVDMFDASHAREAAINTFLSEPCNKMWCMNDNFENIVVTVDEVNSGNLMYMRDFHTEHHSTQERIKDICTPCQWTWDLCPNSMCVMALRSGRTSSIMRVLGNKL